MSLVVHALFFREASFYESCLVSHGVSIYCIMELRTSLQVSILHPIHHSSWPSTLLPFLLGYFFIVGRLYINDVAQQCHITGLSLRPLSFFESIVILFFILYYFLCPRWSSSLEVDLSFSPCSFEALSFTMVSLTRKASGSVVTCSLELSTSQVQLHD